MSKQTHTGYDEAYKAIMEGRAVPHALWVLLSQESDRDGYALKPKPWEGPGEYQHVEIDGEYWRLIRIPSPMAHVQSLLGLYERYKKKN